MPRALIVIVATALAGFATSGCGNADEGKLSTAQGAGLTKLVDTAQAAFDDGDCAQARAAAGDGARRVARLKGDVDDDLRQNLIDGFNHLESELASDCDKPEKTATPEPTVTEAPTEEPTASPSPSPEPTATPSPEPTVTAAPTITVVPEEDTGGAEGEVEE